MGFLDGSYELENSEFSNPHTTPLSAIYDIDVFDNVNGCDVM